MSARHALLGVALLAGCAAPGGPVMTGPVDPVATAAARATLPAAMPDRASLRRIGYRNCDGFAMELLAPARVTTASVEGQALFLRAYPYRGDGAIQTRLPGAAMRVQQQTGTGWRDLPVTASGSASSGGALASVSLVSQMGQVAPVAPGRYRLWLGQFAAYRGGTGCSMSPVWQFDIG